MAKFYGLIGFVEQVETAPGVYAEQIVERPYPGDANRITHRSQPAGQLNDNLSMSTEFSIISDPYAIRNFRFMRYVKFKGTAWKITSVAEQYPRLILSVGGVYNG